MSDSNSEGLQAAVNAAFPVLHGGEEFRDEPALRATLEVPVRAALVAAGLAEVTAERDRLRTAIADAVARLTPSDQPFSEQILDALAHGGRSQARAAGGVAEVRELLAEALEMPRG